MSDNRHRIRKIPKDLGTPRKKLWQAILAVEKVILKDIDRMDDKRLERLLAACGRMGYLIEKWVRVTELSDLEERISKLEKQQQNEH